MKILFFILAFFLVIITFAIIIYNHSKHNKITTQHKENIIQLNAPQTHINDVINYSLTQYTSVSLIVIHNHKPKLIKDKYILGKCTLKTGFHILYLPLHTIAINKDIYIVDDIVTLKTNNASAYITKISVSDINFPSITRVFYVVTLKARNDNYFDIHTYSDVASVFNFLHLESEPNSIVIADFASQNWNSLNRDWKYSTGIFNIPTYVDQQGAVARHGFLFNNNILAKFSIDTVFNVNINSELLNRIQIENSHSPSLNITTDTEKYATSTRFRDTHNFTLTKAIPDKRELQIVDFKLYDNVYHIKSIDIEDIINSIIQQKK